MSKAKFTKGPYEVNDCGLIYGQVSDDEDEAPFVADCCNNPGSGEYTEQEKATATLLAASWDLLEALKGYLKSDDIDLEAPGKYHEDSPLGRALAAISKAKGGAA